MTIRSLLSAMVLVSATAFPQVVPMTNDDCANAIPVVTGINPGAPSGLSGNVFSNVGATQSPYGAGCAPMPTDVWFAYVAPLTGQATVSTCTPAGFAPGSLGDTVLTIIDSGSCPPLYTITCADDNCGMLSTVTFPIIGGTSYGIRISGFGTLVGTFYISITVVSAPSNNDCSGAIGLVPGMNGPYSNFAATDSSGYPSCGPAFADVWFTVGGCVGLLTLDTCGATFDTVLAVYSSCGGPEVACNEDWCGFSSRVSFNTTSTAPYLVRVGALTGNWVSGTFTVTVTWGSGSGLHYSSPAGPGSLRVEAGGLPTSGTYLYAVTFGIGAFPNGWFFGVDIPLAELYGEYVSGWPFFSPLSGCGGFTIGPITGLGALSGSTIYSVAVGFPPSGTPVIHTTPVSYTIP